MARPARRPGGPRLGGRRLWLAPPDDVAGYASRCVRLNASAIPPYPGDPHAGMKNVYACDVDQSIVRANTRPFPDGTLIVKESTRAGSRSSG